MLFTRVVSVKPRALPSVVAFCTAAWLEHSPKEFPLSNNFIVLALPSLKQISVVSELDEGLNTDHNSNRMGLKLLSPLDLNPNFLKSDPFPLGKASNPIISSEINTGMTDCQSRCSKITSEHQLIGYKNT